MKSHIDTEQPATVQEHFDALLADKNSIEDDITTELSVKNLPDWYDEKLFKIGQNYCIRNRLAVCGASLLGVLSAIIIPPMLEILIWTNQSGTPCTAFKRYFQTVRHIWILYTEDVNDPDSRWWKSLNTIRWKHATTSRRSGNSGPGKIYQHDMAITQFGFVGYVLYMPEKFGLTNEPYEREGFNHFWRVTGHVLGISDNLNICRRDEVETTALCEKLQNEIFVKYMKNEPEKFGKMAKVFFEGMWYLDPTLDADCFMYFWYTISGVEYKKKLSLYSQLNYYYRRSIVYFLGVPVVGDILRFLFYYYLEICFFISEHFNIAAWINFGRANAKIQLYSHSK